MDLVGTHDAHHSLRSRGIGIAHSRSEEYPRRRLPRSRSFRVHHFRGFDSLGEKANPPVNLPQPPLAVLIIGVFTAIAVAGSPRHHLRHGRAFPGEQKPVLIFEALQPARRDVVLVNACYRHLDYELLACPVSRSQSNRVFNPTAGVLVALTLSLSCQSKL